MPSGNAPHRSLSSTAHAKWRQRWHWSNVDTTRRVPNWPSSDTEPPSARLRGDAGVTSRPMDPLDASLELPVEVMRSMLDAAMKRVLHHLEHVGEQHARGDVRI